MNFGFTKAQLIGFAVMVLAVILAPFFFYPIVVMQVMCFAVFAMGANLLMGSLGQLSLGQAAYFGVAPCSGCCRWQATGSCMCWWR
jgi:branched-chain amino acid transport system permease protein